MSLLIHSHYPQHYTYLIVCCSRILHKFDSMSSKLTDSAMEVTQVVSQLQTQERKKFITHLKQNMTDKVQVKKQWQELVQTLTHER